MASGTQTSMEILIEAKDKANRVVIELTKSLERAKAALSSAGPAGRDADRAIAGAANSAKKFKDNMDAAEKATQRQKKVLEDVRVVAGAVAVAGGLISGALLKSALDYGKVQAAIAEVYTLTDDTAVSTKSLTADVNKLSTTYGTNTVQTAKGMYQAISAGAKAGAEASGLMDVALRTSIGGVTDVATAVDGLTTIINGYGLKMSDATDVSDSLFVAMKGGKTTIGELSQYLSQASNLAATLGVRYDELLGSVTALTKQGADTGQAFTWIRGVLTAMLNPAMQALLKPYGGAQGAISKFGFAGTLDLIAKSAGGSQEKLRALVQTNEALQAVLGLTGDKAVLLNQAMADQGHRAGALDAAYKKVADTGDFKLKVAMQNLAVAYQSVGAASQEALIPVIEGLSGMLQKLNEMIATNPEAFASLVRVIGALATMATILGTVTLAMAAFRGKALIGTVTAVGGLLKSVDALLIKLPLLSKLGSLGFGQGAAEIGGMTGAIKGMGKALGVFARLAVWGYIIDKITMIGLAWLGAAGKQKASIAQMKKAQEDLADLQKKIDQGPINEANLYRSSKSDTEVYIAQLNEAIKKSIEAQQAARSADVGFWGNTNDHATELKTAELQWSNYVRLLVNARKRLKELEKQADTSTPIVKLTPDQNASTGLDTITRYFNVIQEITAGQYAQKLTEVGTAFQTMLKDMAATGNTEGVTALYKKYVDQVMSLETKRSADILLLQKREYDSAKAYVQQSELAEQEKVTKIVALDKALADAQVTERKRVADAVKNLLNDSLSKEKDYADQVKGITKSIADFKSQMEYSNTDFARQGLDEIDQWYSKLREISSLQIDANYQSMLGNYQKALDINQRRLEVAKSLTGQAIVDAKSGEELVSQARAQATALYQRNSVAADYTRVLEKQKAQAEESQKKQEDITASLRDQLKTLNDSLEKQMSDSRIDKTVVFMPDTKNLDEVINRLLSPIHVPVIFDTQALSGLPLTRARGGYISGPGTATSDSIPAMLSDGEYVVRSAAVSKYGISLLNAINSMAFQPSKLRGFATGGLATNSSQSQAVRDVVDLNFSLGGTTVRLQGARDQVTALVKAARKVKG